MHNDKEKSTSALQKAVVAYFSTIVLVFVGFLSALLLDWFRPEDVGIMEFKMYITAAILVIVVPTLYLATKIKLRNTSAKTLPASPEQKELIEATNRSGENT